MSVLNVQVSCFANYHTPDDPRPVSLLTWLTSAQHADKVARIRRSRSKAQRDRLKAQLPAITPSGLFERREASKLIRHSGLLQLDIDEKDNDHLDNFAELGAWLATLPYVAYVGRSVSGKGWWGLVPISEPDRHREHFRALVGEFREQGIFLDEKPANVAALRGYSYDPEAYFNHAATTYTRVIEEQRPAPMDPVELSDLELEIEAERVEYCLQQLESQQIDLTEDYNDWFALACAFANTFGEEGRSFFHRVSQFYPNYRPRQTDYHFDSALKGQYNYSLGTFFYLCDQVGVNFREVDVDEAATVEEEADSGDEPAQGEAAQLELPFFAQRKPARFVRRNRKRLQRRIRALRAFFRKASLPVTLPRGPFAHIVNLHKTVISHFRAIRRFGDRPIVERYVRWLEALREEMEEPARALSKS